MTDRCHGATYPPFCPVFARSHEHQSRLQAPDRVHSEELAVGLQRGKNCHTLVARSLAAPEPDWLRSPDELAGSPIRERKHADCTEVYGLLAPSPVLRKHCGREDDVPCHRNDRGVVYLFFQMYS